VNDFHGLDKGTASDQAGKFGPHIIDVHLFLDNFPIGRFNRRLGFGLAEGYHENPVQYVLGHLKPPFR